MSRLVYRVGVRRRRTGRNERGTVSSVVHPASWGQPAIRGSGSASHSMALSAPCQAAYCDLMSSNSNLTRRELLLALAGTVAASTACDALSLPAEAEGSPRFSARPKTPTLSITPGHHSLQLGSPRDGYLHIRVTGENTLAVVQAYLRDVHEQCLRAEVPIVLVEECLDGPALPLVEVYKIVMEGSKHISPGVRATARAG